MGGNMSMYQELKRQKKAKRLGIWYFLLLGVVNFGATMIFAEIRTLDGCFLVTACLPLFLSNKIFSAIYGFLGGIIAFMIFYACLKFNLGASGATSHLSFLAGYLLSASMFFASFLLIYGNSEILKDDFTAVESSVN